MTHQVYSTTSKAGASIVIFNLISLMLIGLLLLVGVLSGRAFQLLAFVSLLVGGLGNGLILLGKLGHDGVSATMILLTVVIACLAVGLGIGFVLTEGS